MNFKLASIIALVLLATSCAPQYSTRYHFFPPEHFEGRVCINNCLSNKTSCNQQAQMLEQNCKNSSGLENFANILVNSNKEKAEEYRNYYENEKRKCASKRRRAESECGEYYRDCYTNCGGAIQTETYCSAFCK